MDRHDERLNISALGADVILRPTGATPVEGELTYDVIGHPRGLVVQPHVHPAQEERLSVTTSVSPAACMPSQTIRAFSRG